MWGGVPGGYRNTANDNIVLVLMIETLEGLKNADQIAKVPGVSAIFAASGDLANFSGYRQGQPDYERAINIVHDAAIKAGVRLCGPFAWRDRPDFTCFQAGSETAAIAPGLFAENQGLYITSVSEENRSEVEALCFSAGVECVVIGSVGGQSIDVLKLYNDQPDELLCSIPLADLRAAHEGFFPALMGADAALG